MQYDYEEASGGAATASGMNFQYCATAWVAVWVLAEKEVSPPWGHPLVRHWSGSAARLSTQWTICWWGLRMAGLSSPK